MCGEKGKKKTEFGAGASAFKAVDPCFKRFTGGGQRRGHRNPLTRFGTNDTKMRTRASAYF